MLSQDKKMKGSPIKAFGDDHDSFRKNVERQDRAKWITVERLMYYYLQDTNPFVDVCQGLRLSKKMKHFMYAIRDFLSEDFNDESVLDYGYDELERLIKSDFPQYYPNVKIFDCILSRELDIHIEELVNSEYEEEDEELQEGGNYELF